jgi:hypothetical protein
MNQDREDRLRQKFGPPSDRVAVERATRRRPRPARPTRGVVIAALGVAGVLAVLTVAYLFTPTTHVAAGCFWWTARTIDKVVAGERGCARGYVAVGGSLAESREPAAYRMSFLVSEPDTPVDRPPCPFQPGDAVVIRYHAIFDDGRTVLIVDECR